MTLAEQIRRERKASALTQAAAAEAAGMTQSQWADLEGGRYGPTLPTLRRVAAALGCSLDVRLRRLNRDDPQRG